MEDGTAEQTDDDDDHPSHREVLLRFLESIKSERFNLYIEAMIAHEDAKDIQHFYNAMLHDLKVLSDSDAENKYISSSEAEFCYEYLESLKSSLHKADKIVNEREADVSVSQFNYNSSLLVYYIVKTRTAQYSEDDTKDFQSWCKNLLQYLDDEEEPVSYILRVWLAIPMDVQIRKDSWKRQLDYELETYSKISMELDYTSHAGFGLISDSEYVKVKDLLITGKCFGLDMKVGLMFLLPIEFYNFCKYMELGIIFSIIQIPYDRGKKKKLIEK